MLKIPTIKFIDVKFSDIKLLDVQAPSLRDVPFCCPTSLPESKTGILTREGAFLLLQLHPIVLWSEQKYCILGRRTLHIVSPHILKTDTITVGFISDASIDDVRQWMSVESLLNQIAFATTRRGMGIFETSRLIDSEDVNAVAPLLKVNDANIVAKYVSCSVSAIKKASPTLKKC